MHYLNDMYIVFFLKQMETALHVACWHGFPETVHYLCNYGCDVNSRNKEGETPLIVACARGCLDSVRTLFEHKTNLNIRDKRGNTALHWAVRRHYTNIVMVLIHAPEINLDILDSVSLILFE
jgi:ankyrin repeat protein